MEDVTLCGRQIFAKCVMYNITAAMRRTLWVRRHLVIEQIAALEGDIVCLQFVCIPYESSFMRRSGLMKTAAVIVKRARRGHEGLTKIASRSLSEIPAESTTASSIAITDCNGDSGSRKLVEKTVLNGFGKLNGNGQSMVREIELLCGRTKDKGGKIVDFVEQLHSRGLREDMLSCLPTDSLVKILQGMSNRVTSKKSKINGRAEQLIKHIAEVVSERAQQGDMQLESLIYFLLRITQLDRLELLQVAANLPMQRFDEFYTTGDRGLGLLATALQ
ncbi:hypothetical protein Pmar_PMAR001776, partial [Perkinsus marinus ATCC 50983]